MLRMATLVSFIAFVFALEALAHGSHQPQHQDRVQDRLTVSLELDNYFEQLGKLRAKGYDIAGVDYDKKIVDVIVDQEEYAELGFQNYKMSISPLSEAVKDIDSRYHSSMEVEGAIKRFARDYPELAQAHRVGFSLQGRSIWAIKISDNVKSREKEEPTILFNSMHHAREIMTPEVSIDTIEYLLTRYSTDAKVKAWVDNNEIWVMPMLNVDGNSIVWSRDTMWRKNARGGYGVDINRNYPWDWGKCNGSSGSKRAQDYRGPSAGSEPETQTMMKLVEKIRPVFDISYHSYSELVIYPFGCKGSHASKMVVDIGKKLGDMLNYKPGTSWEILYETDGGDIDWMLGKYQVIPYVLELNSRSVGFHPDYKLRQPTVEKVRVAWQYLLDRLAGPGVRGIMNSESSEQVVIHIKQNGNIIQKYNVNPDGTYHIVLDPGAYELEFQGSHGVLRNEVVNIGQTRVDLF